MVLFDEDAVFTFYQGPEAEPVAVKFRERHRLHHRLREEELEQLAGLGEIRND